MSWKLRRAKTYPLDPKEKNILKIYLNDNDNDLGNIVFSYQGPRYPSKGKDFNLTINKIETRDICIFPSSLFHHTIPFESSEDRICFVFDLVQK